jgi:hypothetical protein
VEDEKDGKEGKAQRKKERKEEGREGGREGGRKEVNRDKYPFVSMSCHVSRPALYVRTGREEGKGREREEERRGK